MYSLLAVDVDGTLLDSAGRLPPNVLSAILSARRQGLPTTLISGRTRVSLQELVEQVALNVPYAGSNGAWIANPGQPQLAAHFPISPDWAAAVLHLAGQAGTQSICFQQPDWSYYDEPGYAWVCRALPRAARFASPVQARLLAEQVPAPAKIELMGEAPSIAAIHARLLQECQEGILVTGINAQFLDVNGCGVDKGKALALICEMLDIPLERAVAVGDGMNDVSMLKAAGLAVAMGNARPEVKACAALVAPSNDACGLAWVIDTLLGKD